MILLGYVQFRDYKAQLNDFEPNKPIDPKELHPLWKHAFKINRFGAYLDLWIYWVCGPLALALGVYSLLF